MLTVTVETIERFNFQLTIAVRSGTSTLGNISIVVAIAIEILAISGSLRADFGNMSILRSITKLALDLVQIYMYTGIGDLPHFNPELDDDRQLQSVGDWRTQLQAAKRSWRNHRSANSEIANIVTNNFS